MTDEMTKFSNQIYYSICEKTIELQGLSKFRTHSTFCQSFKDSILMESFDLREWRTLFELQRYLKLLYGLDTATANEYVVSYFLEEKWLIFEESVKLIKNYFPNSFQ